MRGWRIGPNSVVCDRLITNGSGSGDPDLQGLARERWRGPVPRPTVKCRFFIVARGPVPRDRWMARTLARGTRSHARVACEGPSPTVRGWRFFIVAWGPVPRDRWIARGMARDRPSPYGAGVAFFRRSAGALGCQTRIRAGFPRDRWSARALARACPSPYVKERRFFHRSSRNNHITKIVF